MGQSRIAHGGQALLRQTATIPSDQGDGDIAGFSGQDGTDSRTYTERMQSIVAGRNGVMPPHGNLLGPARTRILAAYIYSLSQDSSGSGN